MMARLLYFAIKPDKRELNMAFTHRLARALAGDDGVNSAAI